MLHYLLITHSEINLIFVDLTKRRAGRRQIVRQDKAVSTAAAAIISAFLTKSRHENE
jgi:hypothetical protein